MPFPPLSLQQRISSSPGRDLFGKKKTSGEPPHTERTGSDRGKQSTSWASANFRHLGRKAQLEKKSPAPKATSGPETQGQGSSWLSVPKAQDSHRGPRRSSSVDSARHLQQGKEEEEEKKELQFTLSLTPEAVLVLQKRNQEKQMLAKQQKCCASAAVDFRHRRVFPSKKTHGGAKCCAPAAEQDITAIVKVSLLNERHKYDDVEYEEEDGDVDETVVRKCKEWLKGVESAAALGKVDKLSALSHLKGC